LFPECKNRAQRFFAPYFKKFGKVQKNAALYFCTPD